MSEAKNAEQTEPPPEGLVETERAEWVLIQVALRTAGPLDDLRHSQLATLRLIAQNRELAVENHKLQRLLKAYQTAHGDLV